MKLYVVRHGETVWNVKKIVQGRSQNRLSKKGREQAEQTAKKLSGKQINMIFSSPLCRTIQTANILNKVINKKIIKDDRITEFEQGIFTKRKKKYYTESDKARKALRLKEDGVESYFEAYERTKLFLEEIKAKYPDKTILIVTHNGIASLIECTLKFGEYNKKDFANLKLFGNAELKEFEI